MIFLAAVLAAGVLHGLRPALAAATVAFFVYNYLFLEPRYSLAIGAPTDFLTLVVFWAVALAAGGLAGRVRDQAADAQRRAAAVSALLAASRTFSAAAGREAAAKALAEQTAAAAGAKAVVLLPPWRTPARRRRADPGGAGRRPDGRRPLGLGEGRGGRLRHRHPAADPLDLLAAGGRPLATGVAGVEAGAMIAGSD
jgi:two-component system sensor histidine kinase KdpD